MKYFHLSGVMVLVGVMVSGCSDANHMGADEQVTIEQVVPVNEEAAPPLEVELINSDGDIVGMASLSETAKGVLIGIKAEGLEPGVKAIHIHQTGLCEAPDFTSAGEHFNPGDKEHGFENPAGYHAGDLPNLEIDAEGKVDLELTVEAVTLKKGAENSLLDDDGSAIVIHEGPDDYKTDPAGKSGDRIVCGVITN